MVIAYYDGGCFANLFQGRSKEGYLPLISLLTVLRFTPTFRSKFHLSLLMSSMYRTRQPMPKLARPSSN